MILHKMSNNTCPITLNTVPANKRILVKNPNGSYRTYHADSLLKWFTEQRRQNQVATLPNTRQKATVQVMLQTITLSNKVTQNSFLRAVMR